LPARKNYFVVAPGVAGTGIKEGVVGGPLKKAKKTNSTRAGGKLEVNLFVAQERGRL